MIDDTVRPETTVPKHLRLAARGVRVALVGALLLLSSHARPQLPGPAEARAGATYYVARSGSDANPGTLAAPWRTISKAVATVSPGATIYVRGGTYNERVLIELQGSSSAITTLAGFPGESATLSGTGIAIDPDEGLVFVLRSSYVSIADLRVEDSSRAGILVDRSDHVSVERCFTRNTFSSGIGVWASRNVTIIGNEVVLACNRGGQECITVAGTDTFEVRGNRVHDADPFGDPGGEGIDAKDGASNGLITGNEVYNIDRVGFYADAWDKHTHDIAYVGNLVHNTQADGFALASEMGGLLERITVANNVVWGNRWIGLTVANYGGVDTHPMHDLLIVNNTIVGNGAGDWGGGIVLDSTLATGVVIRNNILSQSLSFQILVNPAIPRSAFSIDHNLVDGFRDCENEVRGSESVDGDPLFRDPARFDFHLMPGSPAIDHGSPLGAPALDFDGNHRPAGAGIDIGAFEYVRTTGSIVHRRLIGR